MTDSGCPPIRRTGAPSVIPGNPVPASNRPLDAEPGKNPGHRPREHYWDRQPHDSAKQCRVNLSGDDDIRDQRERGGNEHGPFAWIAGIDDCDLIHGVEVTGLVDAGTRCGDNHAKTEWKGQLGSAIPGPAYGDAFLNVPWV
jgi:hypothetical protein